PEGLREPKYPAFIGGQYPQTTPPSFPAASRRASTRFNRRVKSEFNNGVCGIPVRYCGISQTSSSAVIQPSGSKRRRSTGREELRRVFSPPRLRSAERRV